MSRSGRRSRRDARGGGVDCHCADLMAPAGPGLFFLNGCAGLMNGRGLKRLLHGPALSAVGVGLLISICARAQVLEGTAKKGVHAQYNQKTGKPEWVATYLSASQFAGDTELIQGLQL